VIGAKMRKSPKEFRQLLDHYNITVADISRYSGISDGLIYDWLAGRYKPTMKQCTYDKIIEAYKRLKQGKY